MSQTPRDDENVKRDESNFARREEQESELAGWHRMAGVGVEFVAAIALFGAIGYFLDRWLKTGPWILLAGMAIGFAVGLRAMIRAAMKSFRQ